MPASFRNPVGPRKAVGRVMIVAITFAGSVPTPKPSSTPYFLSAGALEGYLFVRWEWRFGYGGEQTGRQSQAGSKPAARGKPIEPGTNISLKAGLAPFDQGAG